MRTLVLLLGAGLLASGGWWTVRSTGHQEAENAFGADEAIRDQDIAFYAARAEADPLSAADLAQLGALYLQRAREGGGLPDYRIAEGAAHRSLALRLDRNGKAALTLASSLLAQHRFPEALEVARGLCPDLAAPPSHCALLAEIQLELGDYDDARRTFASLETKSENLAVAPRLARWYEIQGRTELAFRVLRSARDAAQGRSDLPREQRAWFQLRVADIALRNGKLAEAARALRRGLELAPGDARLTAAMARLEAARGKWRDAIRWGERAGDGADLATLALLGDAHAQLGHEDVAERYFAEAEAFALANAEPFNRQWTLFRLDHNRNTTQMLALLQAEIRIRQDVYGWDQLAWAYYRSGDYTSAQHAMTQALRMGTRDAMLYFHAGLIQRALGNDQAAKRALNDALAVNPRFHSVFSDTAQAVLRSLANQ